MTNEDSLKQYCADLAIVVFQAEIIPKSDRESYNRPMAMRIDVDYDARNTLMSADFLPTGVKICGWGLKYGYRNIEGSDCLVLNN